MRLRRRFTLMLLALLGAAVVVLPAVAGSETTPTIKTEDVGGVYGEEHRWTPEQATTVPAGAVTFVNSSATVLHGVIWTSAVTPSCEPSVPVGAGNFKTSWSGSCTFSYSGEYAFYCSYHGPSMHGRVIVTAVGTTTTTSTPPATSGAPSPSIVGEPGAATPPAASFGSPLLGSAAAAVKLASSQGGKQVRGSVLVAQAGAGGRLEVDLLAKSASLAIAGHSNRTRVGRILRSSLLPGKVSFTVPLNVRARRALHAHRRLALLVEVLLTPPHGSAARITRSVLLHA